MAAGDYKLLNLINADNPIQQPLTLADVSFDPPVVDIGNGWNTKVRVNSLPGSRYIGSVDVCYHRPDLIELNNSVINNIISEVPFTPEIILDLLNTSRGTDFTVDDMEVINIPSMNPGDATEVTLIMKANSFAWVGATNISVLYGLPTNTDILHNLLNHVMPNNNYLTLP